MAAYIVRRLLLLIPTLLGASVLVFSLIRLVPGDFISGMLGTQRALLTEQDAAVLYRMYGLDRSLPLQYVEWLRSIFTGTMGYSFRSGNAVVEEIASRLPLTLVLTFLATALAGLGGLTSGIVAAVKRDRPVDFLSRLVALVGLSLPPFWIALLLILLTSQRFGWVPWGGRLPSLLADPIGNLVVLALPAFVLALGLAGRLMRISRAAMLEVLHQDYVTTARSKGLGDGVVWLRHCLKNALIPIMTFVGMQFGYLIGGAVVIESVFALPGIGRLLVNAVLRRDYPVVQGVVLTIALLFALINLVVDLLYSFVDPRIRYD